MRDSYELLLTSSCGRSLRIAPDAACRLVEGGLSGFDCTGFDVKLRAYADRAGGAVERRRFAERELSLTFSVDAGEAEAVRRQIVSLLDPTAEMTLAGHLGGERRLIDVIPCDEPEFSRPTFRHPMEVTLTFVAPGVFFRAAETSSVVFRDHVPLLTFPMNLWAGAGTAAGIMRVSNAARVENPGDAPCGFRITMRAEGGSVTNPCVSSGSLYVKVPVTLASGDTLTVDTAPGHKTVEINGERQFLFERDSVFFSLPSGESTVAVGCTAGIEYLGAQLSFVPLYFGM